MRIPTAFAFVLRRRVLIGTAALFGWSAIPGSTQAPAGRITVEPNVHVSRDRPAVPHVEPYLAADPGDSRHLVAVSVMVVQGVGPTSTSLASFDGGRSWTRADLDRCDVDPWVAFGSNGTVYASCLNHRELAGIGTRAFQEVRRSTDGGRSWSPPVVVPWGAHRSVDRPMVLVDRSGGPLAGSVLAVRGQSFDSPSGAHRWYGPSVAVSNDGGRTFGDPNLVKFNSLDNQLGDGVVLSDGTLVILFVDFQQRGKYVSRSRSWTVRTRDGGRTFAPPALVVEHYAQALAAGHFGAHPDRLYVVLEGAATPRTIAGGRTAWLFEPSLLEGPAGPSDVFVVYSDDGGESWSDPVRVSDNASGTVDHDVPSIAVNGDGVVGVTWYDRRHDSGRGCFDIYFSASLDGGQTFLPNERVTPATSCPHVAGNRVALARADTLDVGARWIAGGDYSGLAASPDGSFHVLWADSRTAVYQLWTARVQVARRPSQ